MSYKEITAGTKTAKATAARFIKSNNGTVGLEVSFSFTEPTTGTTERLNWQGWLSEKAIEGTMKTLVNVLGFNGDETHNAEGILTNAQALDYNKEVQLVVELEEYDGKQYPKVKWVNNVLSSAFATAAPETIKADLSKVNFKAAYLAAKKATGTNAPF